MTKYKKKIGLVLVVAAGLLGWLGPKLANEHDTTTTLRKLGLCVSAFSDRFSLFPVGDNIELLRVGTFAYHGAHDVERELRRLGVRECGGPFYVECCPYPLPDNTSMTLSVWKNWEDRIAGAQRNPAGYLLTLSAPSVFPWRGRIYAQETDRMGGMRGSSPRWATRHLAHKLGPESVLRDIFYTVDWIDSERSNVTVTFSVENTGVEPFSQYYGLDLLNHEGLVQSLPPRLMVVKPEEIKTITRTTFVENPPPIYYPNIDLVELVMLGSSANSSIRAGEVVQSNKNNEVAN